MKNNFKAKIKIEKIQQSISQDNLWETTYLPWKEIWADIYVKQFSPQKIIFLFSFPWRNYFPENFRIKLNNKIFFPTQPPIQNNLNLFFYATQFNCTPTF